MLEFILSLVEQVDEDGQVDEAKIDHVISLAPKPPMVENRCSH